MKKSGAGRWQLKLGKRLAQGSIVLVLLLAVLYIVFTMTSRHRAQDIVARWEERFGTPEELRARYPHRDANSLALELEGLAARLGVDLATKSMAERHRPSQEAVDSRDRISEDVYKYNREEWSRTGAGSAAPPADLRVFLAAHADDFDEVRRVLLEGEIPRWELHFEKGFEGPIPNLLGHINLHRLLMSEALAQNHAGNTGKALESLLASSRLNTALRDDPILITQLIAVAVHRYHAATIRRLDDVPLAWRERLVEHDFRSTMNAAFDFEGWQRAHIDPAGIVAEFPWWQRILGRISAPYVRLCAYDASMRWMNRFKSKAAWTDPCRRLSGATFPDEAIEPAWWNILAGPDTALPNLLDAFHRVTRMEVDVELTDQWIALTNTRREAGGAWPHSWLEMTPSKACPGEHWEYEIAPDGEASVAFSRDLDWGNLMGPKIPGRRSSAPEGV